MIKDKNNAMLCYVEVEKGREIFLPGVARYYKVSKYAIRESANGKMRMYFFRNSLAGWKMKLANEGLSAECMITDKGMGRDIEHIADCYERNGG